MTGCEPLLHVARHARRCRTAGLFGLALALLSPSAGTEPVLARHADGGSSAAPANRAPALTRALPAGSLAQLPPPRSEDSTTNLEAGWRLLRAADPRSGRESVAVSHTPDLLRSDPAFAGMMLRCSGGEIELLFVLVRPLSPRSRPQVILNFEGKACDSRRRWCRLAHRSGCRRRRPRLPPEAAALAGGAWLSMSELSVVIDDGATTKINGVVILQGLRSAYAALRTACATT